MIIELKIKLKSVGFKIMENIQKITFKNNPATYMYTFFNIKLLGTCFSEFKSCWYTFNIYYENTRILFISFVKQGTRCNKFGFREYKSKCIFISVEINILKKFP